MTAFSNLAPFITESNIFQFGGVSLLSGTGTVAANLTELNTLPVSSLFFNGAQVFTKRAGNSVAADWEAGLTTSDYTTLVGMINSGGSANTALQTLVNAIITSVGLGSDGTLGTALNATNFLTSAASVTAALKLLDTQVHTNTTALATETARATAAEQANTTAITTVATNLTTEVNRAQTAEQTEASTRASAITTATTTAAQNLATEAATRLANDTALQNDINTTNGVLAATQTGAGLAADGSFTAPANTSYLANATTLKSGLGLLDQAITAVNSTLTANITTNATAIATETTARQTAITNLQTTLQSYIDGKVADENTADATEIAARIAGDQALQTQITAVEGAVGLSASGAYVVPTTGTYLLQTTSVMNALLALDTQVHTNTTNLATEISNRTAEDTALQTAINAEATTRASAVTFLTNSLSAAQNGAGLTAAGAYIQVTSANYIASATSLANADTLLDAAIKVVATGLAQANANITALNSSSNSALATETARAEAAEQANTTAIAAEATTRAAAVTSINASIAAYDQKQTELAALVLAARKESKSTSVTTSTVVDYVSTQQVEAAKWMVYVKETGSPANRAVYEVLAIQNGDASITATAVSFTQIVKLQLGTLPSDLAFNIVLSGTGSAQQMQLTAASPTTSVDVFAVRERIPGLDVDSSSDYNSWTVNAPTVYFGSAYVPNTSITF